ncbi:putative zinc-type alcohol dehydrogenase-like protein [Roseimicrobium gellanilyticum]|uniref:alcohol dehydrogenase (NADP(+)) n=1 Tax=Roseimicrobium gellanilyticum TaxID=748857 RepID=A0A366HDE1_9BACT|nr:NAD(P)-dependent alcohol dehydrogenase [Roseimicrobium gellanilyticum]RBP40471.1 putative zinc-type alcohol dehydrogenase-like protein [Roseimicrobium gellanilyticum]
MKSSFHGFASLEKGKKLESFSFDPGPLGDEQVEIAVEYCGVCHSDLSMIDNEWGMSAYPLVPGHEVVGRIVEVGGNAKGLKVGQRVGVGWFSGSCMHCAQCLSGNHNLCPNGEGTIVNRHGGFANRVRAHWAWATLLPEQLDGASAGPLFCGGITVFNPIVQFGVRPTDRVGVIGIGGLGHMAVQFLSKWGCEVFAFTSSDSKREEAMKMGAHQIVNSRDEAQLKKIAGSLDFIISTVNVAMPWDAILSSLAPKGRLHLVGAVLEPIPVGAFSLIGGQKSISGSPVGGPATVAKMLDFASRHKIPPITEEFPMSQVNEALDHVRAGKARYRVVLKNDLG